MSQTSGIITARARRYLSALASQRRGGDAGVLVGYLSDLQPRKNSMPTKQPDSKPRPHADDVHVRYAVQGEDGSFVGHRRYNHEQGSYCLYGPFKYARIFTRHADAVKAKFGSTKDKVVEITCVIGTPYAVFMEAP